VLPSVGMSQREVQMFDPAVLITRQERLKSDSPPRVFIGMSFAPMN
jgi:hypothetical protein